MNEEIKEPELDQSREEQDLISADTVPMSSVIEEEASVSSDDILNS